MPGGPNLLGYGLQYLFPNSLKFAKILGLNEWSKLNNSIGRFNAGVPEIRIRCFDFLK
jgi:hypothetical protein